MGLGVGVGVGGWVGVWCFVAVNLSAYLSYISYTLFGLDLQSIILC